MRSFLYVSIKSYNKHGDSFVVSLKSTNIIQYDCVMANFGSSDFKWTIYQCNRGLLFNEHFENGQQRYALYQREDQSGVRFFGEI